MHHRDIRERVAVGGRHSGNAAANGALHALRTLKNGGVTAMLWQQGGQADLSRVIQSIHDCALNPQEWWTTLPVIAALTQSTAAVLSICGEGIFYCGHELEHVRLYEEYFTKFNPSAQPPRQDEGCPQRLADDGVKFLDGPAKSFRYTGLGDALGVIVKSGRRVLVMMVNRLESQAAYSISEINLFRLLGPHLQQTLKIANAIDQQTERSAAFEATLNALSAGVYLTNRQSQIIYMNFAAKRQVSSGTVLCVANNRLSPTSAHSRTAFDHAMATVHTEVASGSATSIAVPLHEIGGRGLLALVVAINPLKRQTPHVRVGATCAVFVKDPQIAPPLALEAFARLHSLTPGQLRVLIGVVEGRQLQEVANMLGIELATVKSHLHTIFDKTGTSRQADLIRLLLIST
jgi:DNA-binding CsgD family transcriptional regulator